MVAFLLTVMRSSSARWVATTSMRPLWGWRRRPMGVVTTSWPQTEECSPSETRDYRGSMGGQHLNAPIVGMASTPNGGGYYLAAADGGVFSFGVPYLGSMSGIALNKPVAGMAATPNGAGYYLVAADGGVFSFGVPFFGSIPMSVKALNKPVVGMQAVPGGGYYLVAVDGGVFSFGVPFLGSTAGDALSAAIVGIAR